MFVKLIQGHRVNKIQVQAFLFPNSLLCSWLHKEDMIYRNSLLGEASLGQQIFSHSVTDKWCHWANY